MIPREFSSRVQTTLLALVAALSTSAAESPLPYASAYRELSLYGGSPASQLLIREGKFDLADPVISKYFLERLNSPSKRGNNHSTALRGLLTAQPEKTYLWLLKNFPHISPMGRMNLVSALALEEVIEADDLRILMIQDKTFIPYPDEWQIRRPPGHLWTMRVCDGAYVSFASGLALAKVGLPEDLLTHFAPELPRERCDESIAKFLDWWGKNRARVIEGKRSLATESPEIAAALRVLKFP